MDFEAEGLLDGLQGEQREARRRLVQSLLAEGFELQELKAAAAEDRLVLLPVQRALSGRYTASEVEERTGLPAEALRRTRRLLGLPEPEPGQRAFTETDVEAARSIQMFLEAGMREESIAEITRVLGEALARVAATTAASFAESFLQAGDHEDEVAWRFADLTRRMTPGLGPVLEAAYESHLRDNVRRATIRRTDLEAGQIAGEQDVAVCFADLVGFTRLGVEVDPEQLGGVVGTFAELASDVAQDPVRLVKTIGDAAMLISREPAPLVEAALTLLDRVEEADLPPVRAGIAWGTVLPRSGDLYGHAVNLASRVTAIARPSSILCDKAIRDASREQLDWSFAGRHRLKGIGEAVPLYRARRLADGGAETAEARKPTADRRRTRASS